MKYLVLIFACISVRCDIGSKTEYEIAGNQSKIVTQIIEAVNEKDYDKYVSGFAEDVQIFIESEIRLEGRQSLRENRANHFKNYPEIRSEIQHIVEIDNKVVLHDKVWLSESSKIGQNIVEIFTFEDDMIVRMDVIQPNDLFKK